MDPETQNKDDSAQFYFLFSRNQDERGGELRRRHRGSVARVWRAEPDEENAGHEPPGIAGRNSGWSGRKENVVSSTDVYFHIFIFMVRGGGGRGGTGKVCKTIPPIINCPKTTTLKNVVKLEINLKCPWVFINWKIEKDFKL